MRIVGRTDSNKRKKIQNVLRSAIKVQVVLRKTRRVRQSSARSSAKFAQVERLGGFGHGGKSMLD